MSLSASEQYERRVGSTPRKIESNGNYQYRRKGPKDDFTFSAPTDAQLDEFDFESNLALFDKQAVFQEIDKEIGVVGYPKVVQANFKQPGKYRCDENVLESEPVVYRQIKVPNLSGKEYVTGKTSVQIVLYFLLKRQLLYRNVTEKNRKLTSGAFVC